jgi:hypothetical protein
MTAQQIIPLQHLSLQAVQQFYIAYTKDLLVLQGLQHPQLMSYIGFTATVDQATCVMEVRQLHILEVIIDHVTTKLLCSDLRAISSTSANNVHSGKHDCWCLQAASSIVFCDY